MSLISPQMEEEISRRVSAGQWNSPDDLLSKAFQALDKLSVFEDSWLEQELLKGLEGEEVEMTRADWESIRQEGLALFESGKSR